MKIPITILFLFAAISNLSAEMSVKSFYKVEKDMDARIDAKKTDQNGEVCAIIKVETTQTGFSWDSDASGITAVVPKVGEYWIYVPNGAKRLTIKHPQLGILRDYLYPLPIEKATVYVLSLVSGKITTIVEETIESQWLTIRPTPTTALVYIDNQFVSTGEYSAKLKSGSYVYKVEAPLYHSEVGKLEITDGKKEMNVALRPAFGYMQVSSAPESGAKIIIDGKEQPQTTPAISEAFASGEHTVQVIKEMYQPSVQRITVSDGQTSPVNFTLQPNFAQMSITAPASASILINGTQKGTGTWNGRLNAGVYTLEARMEKHRTAKQDIELSTGDTKTIDLRPTPIYGSVDVISSPSGATITMNGKDYGTTPNKVKNLCIGEYVVQLNKHGYTTITKNVTVIDGKCTEMDEVLTTKNDHEAESYYKSGKAKYDLKDYKGAIVDCTKAIEIDTKYLDAYKGRGDSKYALNDYIGAITDYSMAIEINPKYVKAYYNRSLVRYNIQEYNNAIVDLTKVIELSPNDSEAFSNRGDAKDNIKDYNGAIEDYTKAIEIDPNNAKYYFRRGGWKYNLGDYKGAISDYTKVIEIDNVDAGVYYWRGQANYHLGVYAGAINDFTKFIENTASDNTLNSAAYYWRGMSKGFSQDYDGAISDFDKAIVIKPENVEAVNARGWARCIKNEFSAAIIDFDNAISIDNTNSDAYFKRGLAKNSLKDYNGAICDFTKTIELDPKSSDAYFNRGVSSENSGDYIKAIADFTKTIEINSKYPNAFYRRGVVKFCLSDNVGAIADYTKAIELNPNDD